MKIYKIYQNVNNDWDTYDSAIVVAETEEEAKSIHPRGDNEITTNGKDPYSPWCKLDDVKVEYLGIAKDELKKGVIIGSFNAG